MSFADNAIDHSKLEEISCNGTPSDEEDEVYQSDDDKDADEDDVRDTFANETVVANKKCKIYPKSRHYAVVRFGDSFTDKAIALPKVICHEDEVIDGEKMMSDISWGHDGWINARRDPSSSVKWKATLLWTGMRKPAGLNNNAHHDDELWRQLLQEYQDLGDVDVSMKRVPVPTLKSLADDLNASEKLFAVAKENGTSTKDFGACSKSREFSNMLEDIDVSLKDEQKSEQSVRSDDLDTPRSSTAITVKENFEYVAVVQKVERDRLIFMPLVGTRKHQLPTQYQGSYSLSVQKKNIYIRGEWAGSFDLKERVCPGESFNIRCDLLFDKENKDMYGDVKSAWNGKAPNLGPTTKLTTKSNAADCASVADNKSLEPIDVSSDSTKPDVIKNIYGKVKQLTPSFVCVEPDKQEYRSKEPYPVMSHSFYFANGKRGDGYTDLTESELKLEDIVKMSIAEINGKMLVISAWEPGAKPPKNDEAKANEWAKRIRSRSQKPASVVSHSKLEEPTPQSQMSARPHSPSHFQLGELRRPKTAGFRDSKPPTLRIPEKPPQLFSSFHSSENVSDVLVKKVSKGIMSSKSTNLARPKTVSYQEPLSPSPTVPQCSSFVNKEPKNLDSREFNNESDNKTVSFSEKSNPQAVLNIIERSFQKSIEKMKPSVGCEGANALREQLLASTKQTYIESLYKELQVSIPSAERSWSTFENFINHLCSMGAHEMKGDVASTSLKRGLKCDNSGGDIQTCEAGTQTTATGRVFFESFVHE